MLRTSSWRGSPAKRVAYLPRAACVRGFRDAARTQRALNKHEHVVRAVVRAANGADGKPELRAIVLPKISAPPKDAFVRELQQYLAHSKFTGRIDSISFVVNELDLSGAEHSDRDLLHDDMMLAIPGPYALVGW